MSLRKEKKLVREFVDFQAACKNFVKTRITEKKIDTNYTCIRENRLNFVVNIYDLGD